MTHEVTAPWDGDGIITTQVAALAARVWALEGQQEISQLIATYGPAVDSLSADTVAEIEMWRGWCLRFQRQLPHGSVGRPLGGSCARSRTRATSRPVVHTC